MSIEAMKMALGDICGAKLCEINSMSSRYEMIRLQDCAIATLRQAIEQAEKQEPFGYFQLDLRMDAWVQNRDNKKGVPFYTAPTKREWVGLTDDEIAMYDKRLSGSGVACDIEAKLKEKNDDRR
jgi:hypothetical protein